MFGSFLRLEMEGALQNGTIEKDDSFSILFDSAVLRSQMDEMTEIRYLVDKLAEVRTKHGKFCESMADEFDIVEAKHAEENAAKQGESEATLKKLQDTVQSCAAELKSQTTEKDTVNQYNRLLIDLLVSIHDRKCSIKIYFCLIFKFTLNRLIAYNFHCAAFTEIRNFFEQVKAREEVVTIESATEDDVSDHDEQNDKDLVEEQAQVAENTTSSTEVVQNDRAAHETEQVQQNLSNGNAHEETEKPNDDQEKENVRPESTSIVKEDATTVTPVVSSASTSSIIETIPKVAAPPKAPLVEQAVAQNLDEPGTSGVSKPKKQFTCVYCDEVFTERSLVFQHWKKDHGVHVDVAYNIRKVSKRKRTVVDNKATDDMVDDDNNIIEILPNKNGRYVTSHSNPMKQAVKRQKKIGTKIFYLAHK